MKWRRLVIDFRKGAFFMNDDILYFVQQVLNYWDDHVQKKKFQIMEREKTHSTIIWTMGIIICRLKKSQNFEISQILYQSEYWDILYCCSNIIGLVFACLKTRVSFILICTCKYHVIHHHGKVVTCLGCIIDIC